MACSMFKVLLRTFLDIGHADMAQIFCEGTSRRPLSRCLLSVECASRFQRFSFQLSECPLIADISRFERAPSSRLLLHTHFCR